MRRLKRKLNSRRGVTLVEMVAATAVLALLGLMLHTGLAMAQNSYIQATGAAERQLLLSTLTDLLSNELRYARKVTTQDDGTLLRYTSVNYGINTSLALNAEGQLEANKRNALSTGAYGNGDYRIDRCNITYQEGDGVFRVELEVSGRNGSDEAAFSVRCLNP